MTQHFDWNTNEAVIRPQPAIAIQGDANGDLLMRQEGMPLYGWDDQFLDVRRDSILTVCRAMLREGGLHRYMIVAVDEIGIEGRDGNELTIPASDLEKLDRIAEEVRQEEIAMRPRWDARPEPASAPNQGAARRKRRQRQRQREAHPVITSRPVTRDSVTAPRLPAEFDPLQRGGAKQPVVS